jgi:stage IV sporulation protein B
LVKKVLTGLLLALCLTAGSLTGLDPGDLRMGLSGPRGTTVETAGPVRVYPGGESIGVLWKTGRLAVSGYAPLRMDNGRYVCPAAEAGITPGDILLSVNGRKVGDPETAAALIDRGGGGTVRLELRRGKKIVKAAVKPVRCRATSRYRIGLLLRDGAAGIGTLTFFDARTHRYAAVGHPLTPEEEGLSSAKTGWLMETRIEGIVPGQKGQPGEKVGLFLFPGNPLGNIESSNRYGIFGSLSRLPATTGSPVPVATASQVHTGPCEILTVVQGQKVERFAAEILWVRPGAHASGRGLGLRITDPRLLSLAGGIVQGMSGSPVVQDGLLAGAVSHVFLHDPTRGFGVLAEWMLSPAGFFCIFFRVVGGAFGLAPAIFNR